MRYEVSVKSVLSSPPSRKRLVTEAERKAEAIASTQGAIKVKLDVDAFRKPSV